MAESVMSRVAWMGYGVLLLDGGIAKVDLEEYFSADISI